MDVDSFGFAFAPLSGGLLQWSHVLMDVDSLGRVSKRENNRASMEPRPDGRG